MLKHKNLIQKLIQPKRFLLTYCKKNGEVQTYEVSNPIEATKEKFTTFCFSRHGLRSFLIDKVLDLKEIKIVRKIK